MVFFIPRIPSDALLDHVLDQLADITLSKISAAHLMHGKDPSKGILVKESSIEYTEKILHSISMAVECFIEKIKKKAADIHDQVLASEAKERKEE